MKSSRIFIGFLMTLKMLIRRRISLILLLVIPIFFLSIVELTTSERIVPFKLASVVNHISIEVQEKGISHVFFAVAAAGFLVSFLALTLIQKETEVNKRLVICGFHPVEILLFKLMALFLMINVIAAYIGILTRAFFPIEHLFLFIIGLILTGLVYGCYGLAVGSIIKGELEGILFIVLLVNIDAGWLQNPLFYAESQNQTIIEFLPAYYPAQTSIIGAFTDYSILNSSLYSLCYGALFLGISILVISKKMRLNR